MPSIPSNSVEAESANCNLSPEFLPRLVHELRSPAHSIACFLPIFREELGDRPLSAEAQEALGIVENASSELRALLRSLGNYVHALDDKQPMELDVSKFVQRAWQSTCKTAAQPFESALSSQCQGAMLFGDDLALSFGLQAIFDNSIKFRSPERELSVEVSADVTESETIIRITDNGIGIERQFIAKCYQDFERLHTRSAFPGAGLGIPCAMNCIDHMHGKLSLSSDGKSGATVTLTFPKVDRPG